MSTQTYTSFVSDDRIIFTQDGTNPTMELIAGNGTVTFCGPSGAPLTSMGGITALDIDGPVQLKETGGGDGVIGLKAPGSITPYDIIFPATQGASLTFLQNDGSGNLSWTVASGTGDVVGPGSSTDNALVKFDLASGKVIQNSGAILDDSNNLSGLGTLTVSGVISGVSTPVVNTDAANKAYVDGPDTNYPWTNVNSATYTALSTDQYIGVSYTITGTCTITLPAIGTVGKINYEIIDTGGNAHNNNITIDTTGGDTIIGNSNIIISEDYNSVTLSNDGNSEWLII